MKFSLALATALLCAASASAFTVDGSRNQGVTSLSRGRVVSDGVSTPVASSTTLQMATSAEFIKSEISSNDVVVFSKSFCPFCKKTKKLLTGLGIDAKIYELDKMDDGADIQDSLLELSGQRTVPNVYVKGKHLGGNDDTQKAAKTGSLQEMLGI